MSNSGFFIFPTEEAAQAPSFVPAGDGSIFGFNLFVLSQGEKADEPCLIPVAL